MKIILFFLIFINFSYLFCQEIIGVWNGKLSVQGTDLRLVFHVKYDGVVYSSIMDSPDQGVKGIATTSTTFIDSVLKIEISNMKISYEAKLIEHKLDGVFKQG